MKLNKAYFNVENINDSGLYHNHNNNASRSAKVRPALLFFVHLVIPLLAHLVTVMVFASGAHGVLGTGSSITNTITTRLRNIPYSLMFLCWISNYEQRTTVPSRCTPGLICMLIIISHALERVH